MIPEWEIFGRLALACILGGIIGYERQERRKSAGLRTNILVCLGSCLIMILSVMMYKSVEGYTNADPARLAAQVVSGIGFLGAGAIMKEGVNITGLTTAACLWVVAGVGLAVGFGYYSGATMAAVLVFVTIRTLSYFELGGKSREKVLHVQIVIDDYKRQLDSVTDCFKELGMEICKVKLKEKDTDTNINETGAELEANASAVIEMMVFNNKKIKKVDVLTKLNSLPEIRSVNIR